MKYCAITADINKSKEVADRAALQREILRAIGEVNASYSNDLAVPFAITIGDEWQGLLKNIGPAYRVIRAFRAALKDVGVAFGVGEGDIATPIAARTADMDGTVFHRARQALDRAKDEERDIVFITETPEIDRLINALAEGIDIIRNGWTAKQERVFELYRKHGVQAKVAEELGVTAGSVSQALTATDAVAVIRMEDELDQYLIDHSRR